MKKIYFSLWISLVSLGIGPGRLLAQHRPGLSDPMPPGAPLQTARTELLLEPTTSEAHVQPLAADSTVVVLVGRSKPSGHQAQFAFQQYDHNLALRYEQPIEVPDEYSFVRLCAEPHVVYAVFISSKTPGLLLVAAYNGRNGQALTQAFDTRLTRDVLELKAVDGKLFATVALADGQHLTALLLEVATGRLQYLSSVYERLPTQLSFVADASAGRADYVLSETNGRKSRLLLKRLGGQGQLLSSEFVQAESERNLLTAQLSPLQDTTARLLTGTYSLRDTDYAQGLFATDLNVEPGRRPPLRFYDFRRLKHFFDYLSPTHQARLQRRSDERLANDQEPQHWHYRLLLHELLPQADGGYVLAAEVYAPHYRASQYGYSAYNRTALSGLNPGYYDLPNYGANGRLPDGYQTSQVVVCGFDRSGTLLWDNTFVLNDVHRTDLEETVRLLPLPDGRLVLAYLQEEKLHYKLVDRAEAAPNDLAVPLFTPLANAPEKVLGSGDSDLLPWFGNRFVASGYQRIRREGGPEREVFFLNSLAF